MPTPCNVFILWRVQMAKQLKHGKPESGGSEKANSSAHDNSGSVETCSHLPHDSSLADIHAEALRRGCKFPEKRSMSSGTRADKLMKLFNEVLKWVDNNKHPPRSDSSDFEERCIHATLDGLRRDPSMASHLREMDKHYGLLNPDSAAGTNAEGATRDCAESPEESGIQANEEYDELMDKLTSLGYKPPESITTLKFVRSADERKAAARERPDEIAKRLPCVDFDLFRSVFKDVQKKLDDGFLTTRKLEGKSDIKANEVYKYGGRLAYIGDVGKEFSKNHRTNSRLRVIFDNGMESNILKTTFLLAMAKDPTSRVVTEGVTGWIYVLQSLSEDPEIRDRRDILHKIGFTTTKVDKRLSTAHMRSTYLNAPVKSVRSYEISTVHPRDFERVFHAFFAPAKVSFLMDDGVSKKKRATEWFEVPIEAIDEFVKVFLEVGEGIGDYRYDEKTASIVKR